MPGRVRIKDHWNEQRIFIGRTFAAMVIIALLTVILIGRLSYLQIVRHEYYVGLSQGNRVRLEPIPASRGLILDRNGQILVDNEPAYQLELVRDQVPDLEGTLQRLIRIGLLTPDDLEQTRRTIMSRRKFDRVPIRLRLTDEEIGRFAVHRFEFQGVDLQTRQTRHYPYGELGVHALGYVAAISADDLEKIDVASYAGTTLIGKLGVEAAYEFALHGRNGTQEVLVNAEGRAVDQQGAYRPELQLIPATAGQNLILSIDLATQQAAEAALGDHRGAVVAIDPGNGDVLALVSLPGFDPALFSRGLSRDEYAKLSDDEDKPLLNRALRGAYPSGSTIKPVIALAGLTDHVVDPEHLEYCNGVFHLPGSTHEFHEALHEKHGPIALVDAIAKSCDVYFYGLAAKLGIDRISSFMAPFGYGQVTGIDIGGEKPGLLPSTDWKRKTFKKPQDVWFPGDTVNLGVGQGYLLVTPLQLAHIAGVLAERGRSFQPRLVTAWRVGQGDAKPIAPMPQPAVEGISDTNWDLAIRGMVGAMTYGTAAASGKGLGYTMAGKTGTAQVFSLAPNARYNAKTEPERLRDHSWFIAFAPVEAPRIAVCVLVENGGFGASVAAPIARKVIDAYLLGKTTAVAGGATP